MKTINIGCRFFSLVDEHNQLKFRRNEEKRKSLIYQRHKERKKIFNTIRSISRSLQNDQLQCSPMLHRRVLLDQPYLLHLLFRIGVQHCIEKLNLCNHTNHSQHKFLNKSMDHSIFNFNSKLLSLHQVLRMYSTFDINRNNRETVWILIHFLLL